MKSVAEGDILLDCVSSAVYWPDTDDHLGSIAQYWQNVLPETVVNDKNGFLAMNYDVIALLSTIAVARRIMKLEKEIEELKQRIK